MLEREAEREGSHRSSAPAPAAGMRHLACACQDLCLRDGRGEISKPLWTHVLFSIVSVGNGRANSQPLSSRENFWSITLCKCPCFLTNWNWLKIELLFLMRFSNSDQFEIPVQHHKLRVLSWLNSVCRSVGLFQEVKVFTKERDFSS